MTDFDTAIDQFTAKVEVRTLDVLLRASVLAFESIVIGSPLTNAPGQPVDTGNLRASWQLEIPSPTTRLISTNVDYAPVIEDNERGVTFRNHGPHSVKLTIASMSAIVDQATRDVVGGDA